MRSVFLPDALASHEMAGAWEHGRIALVLGAWCIGGLILCLTTFRWRGRRERSAPANRGATTGLASATQHHGTWTVAALPLWELYFASWPSAESSSTPRCRPAGLRGAPGGRRRALAGADGGLVRGALAAGSSGGGHRWRGWVFQAVLLTLFVVGMALTRLDVVAAVRDLPAGLHGAAASRGTRRGRRLRLTPAVVFAGNDRRPAGDHHDSCSRSGRWSRPSPWSWRSRSRAPSGSARNGRPDRRARASRAEVARLSREAGVAEERQRLAGEIHDTVAQGLSSVVMLVEAALVAEPRAARHHLDLAARTARDNLDETRAIVAALTPRAGPGDIAGRTPCVVRSTVSPARPAPQRHSPHPARPARCRPAVEVVLLRVVQEALNERPQARRRWLRDE